VNRGIALIIGGLILTLASDYTWGFFADVNYITLMPSEVLPWNLNPDESISRGFDTRNLSEYTFFLDYFPRGVEMNLQITDSDEKIVFQEDLNDYFLDSPVKLEPNTYYVAKITNKGNEEVTVGDTGFLTNPVSTQGENLALPFDELYTIIPLLFFLVGIIVSISGVIIFFKDRKKKLNL